MNLVAFDPGLRRSGVAVFVGGALVFAASLLTNQAGVADMVREFSAACTERGRLICEWPPDAETKVLVTAIEDIGWPETQRVRATSWKGKAGKRDTHRRVAALLTDEEKTAVGLSGLGQDAKDAIGLGLWALGRLG